MKSLRKSLVALVVAFVLCASLLIGTTFAWFTDNLVSNGNKISAGSLKVAAYTADVENDEFSGTLPVTLPSEAYEVPDELEFATLTPFVDGSAIITEENWVPGNYNAKLIQVENAGTLAAQVKIVIAAEGNLTGALWFDLVQATFNENEQAVLTGTFQPVSYEQFVAKLANVEVTLQPKDTQTFALIYGFVTDAGNEYNGAEWTATMAVESTQVGGEYEEVVATAEDFTAALTEGGNIVLGDDIDVLQVDESGVANDEAYIEITEDTVIDLNGNDLSFNGEFNVVNGAEVEFKNGNLTDTASVASSGYYLTTSLYVDEASILTLENVTFNTVGTGVYVHGKATAFNLIDSEVYASGVFGVTTNAAVTGQNVVINIENSKVVAGGSETYTTDYDSVGVLVNIPCSLTIKDSYIQGDRQGVVVRAGTATIENTTIVCTADYNGNSFYPATATSNWGTGDEVPAGVLIVGNRSTSYEGDIDVTIKNVTLTLTKNTENNDFNVVYVYGFSGTKNGATVTHSATFTYDAASISDANVIVAAGNSEYYSVIAG